MPPYLNSHFITIKNRQEMREFLKEYKIYLPNMNRKLSTLNEKNWTVPVGCKLVRINSRGHNYNPATLFQLYQNNQTGFSETKVLVVMYKDVYH